MREELLQLARTRTLAELEALAGEAFAAKVAAEAAWKAEPTPERMWAYYARYNEWSDIENCLILKQLSEGRETVIIK